MARFDVHRLRDGSLVVDCQAEFLEHVGTRFVVPLLPRGEGPAPNMRINPEFVIGGERMVLVTQFAASIRTSELHLFVTSLVEHQYGITNAIDVLIGTA